MKKLIILSICLCFSLVNLAQTINKDVSFDGGTSYNASGSVDVSSIFQYRLQYTFPSTTSNFANVVITDQLPPELQYIALADSPHASGTYNAGTHMVTFNFTDPIASGATGELLIYVRFPTGTYTGTNAMNNATMTDDTGIPTPIISPTVTATATNGTTPPVISNGVDIHKYNSANEVSIGSGLYWNIRYGTLGGEVLNNLVIEDCFPQEFILESFKFDDKFVGSVNVVVKYKTWDNALCVPNSTWQTWGTYTTAEIEYYVSALGLPANTNIACMRFEFDPIPAGTNFHYDLDSRLQFFGDISTVHFNSLENDACGNLISVPGGGFTISNCADMTAVGATTSTNYSETHCDNNTTIFPGRIAVLDIDKTFLTSQPYAPGEVVRIELEVQSPPENAVTLTNPTVVDLLPPELEYVGNATFSTNWIDTVTYTQPTFSATPNFDGTGQTLLQWTWDSANPATLPATTLWTELNIEFDVQVKWGTPNGNYINIARGWVAETVDFCQSDFFIDSNDFDIDSDRTETLCGRNEPFEVFKAGPGAGLDAQKWVKGECDTDWSRFPDYGLTTPGGKADYLLWVINPGDVSMTDIVVIDILPFVGDKGVIDLSDRNSEWQPVLAGTVTAPAGVTVYYSTEANPCRDELTPGIPVGCNAPNWTTTPPTDITTVQSLKFDFGTTVLNPPDTLELTWPMRAPINAPTTGEVAWNSFGYTATRTDNSSQLLASEPFKVGIATKAGTPGFYGDYVWLDSDLDGVQDVEEIGINGVIVELYVDDGDNIAEPDTDDTLWSFTITSNDGTNDGAYLFSNLPANNYFAVFYPLAAYTASPNGGTADPALDSDGVVGTVGGQSAYITPVTAIGALETDDNWDQGFFNTNGAPLLGDFVWKETTCDGLQQGGELGIENVIVTLHDMANGGEEIGKDTTDVNGFYLFGGGSGINLYPDAAITTYTVSSQIDSGSDDVEYRIGSSTLSIGSSDIEIVDDSGTPQEIGLRFNNVAVPQGATISSAYILFTADDDAVDFPQSDVATITIDGELNTNPVTFSSGNPPPSRPRTSSGATATWSPPAWNTPLESGVNQQTSDLSAIVQEIVNQGGWAINNSMAFFLNGSGEREAGAFEDGNDTPAQLFIQWQEFEPTIRQLQAGHAYELRIDTNQTALTNLEVSPQNAGGNTSNNSTTDTNDSDAAESGGNAVIAFTSDVAGSINYGYDFGFCSTLVEICDNGIDDDGDTFTDCADPDCMPTISNVNITQPTCPLINNGVITITASGGSSSLQYSINGGSSYQASNSFSGLSGGNYNIQVRTTVGTCVAIYGSNPVILNTPTCTEICDDGIDNDGDSLVDCDDPDCQASGISAGLDQELCATTTTTLNGSGLGAGETGQWTLENGTGVTINSPTSATTTINGLTLDQCYTFRWTVTPSGGCPAFDEVAVCTYSNVSADAGADIAVCGTTYTTIFATPPTVGTGTWTLTQGTGLAFTPNASSSLVTGLQNGIYEFTWTVTNGSCTPASDTMSITVTDCVGNCDCGGITITRKN